MWASDGLWGSGSSFDYYMRKKVLLQGLRMAFYSMQGLELHAVCCEGVCDEAK